MIDLHLCLEPHVGAPIVSRAEAEAARRHRTAKKEGRSEPFERHLADAYAAMLSGSAVLGPARRPEVVVLVTHEVARRGWGDVREGEVCKIPGIGPVAPSVAKEIAQDAFLTGVFYDGVDLRHFRRWTRDIPVGVRSRWSWETFPTSTGSPARTAGIASGMKRTTSSPTSPGPRGQRQPRAPVPAVPPGQDRARPKGRQAHACPTRRRARPAVTA
jgi:hypothetical protein